MGSQLPDKRGRPENKTETPKTEQPYGREADARNPAKPTAAAQANPQKAHPQANQRMQPDDYRNVQQSLEGLSNADHVAPISYPTS